MNSWEGDLVRLRGFEARDAEDLAARYLDAESVWLGGLMRPPQTVEAERHGVEQRANQPPAGDDANFAIETLAGAFAGTIGTRNANHRHGTFDYGIDIVREHRGKGYGNDALRLLLHYFFDELRYVKANGQVFAYNEPSQRFHERFGFQLEGRIRDGWHSAGEQHDILWYGITAAEFGERERGRR